MKENTSRIRTLVMISCVLVLSACSHVSANVTAENDTQTYVVPAAYAGSVKSDTADGYTTAYGVHVPPASSGCAQGFNSTLDKLEYLMAQRSAQGAQVQ